MEDLATIRKVLKGSHHAFGKLVRKYQGKVYYLCLQITKNTADAEDAAQECFIKAYRSLHRFRGESAFSTWLYAIARNCALDVLKHRRDTADIEEMTDLASEILEYDPEGSAISKESAEKLISLIGELPEEFRSVLILREIKGMSYQEIAELLEIGEGTVKSRLYRSRERLREKIRGAGL